MQYRYTQAMIIADQLSTLDSEMINLVAERLVNGKMQAADSLQFALNVAIQENLVARGFSNKVHEPI